MSYGFSSLESINKLISNIISSNKDALSLKHINELVNDFSKLLNESDFYDTEIRVGMGKDVKTFKVHSDILKARSEYFKTALSKNWIKRSDSGKILFQKENVSPKIFEVLLKYDD